MAKRIANKIRTLFSDDNYERYVRLAESANENYKLTLSNYTASIESDFLNISFRQEDKGNDAFIASAMIKRDILATGLAPPDINPDELVYFNFSIPEKLKRGKHEIYNIDLKSAYASILANHSLISHKTNKYLSNLSKPDRLACVGMLAAKKEVYYMHGDSVLKHETIVLSTRSWFYFCVKRTNEIIDKCRDVLGRDFLFYWVDGIFFDNIKNADKVRKILDKLGYRYSFETCTDFEYTETKKSKKVNYLKDGEPKELYIPKKNKDVDEFLIKFLKFHNDTEHVIIEK
jgi:hypothetical protein